MLQEYKIQNDGLRKTIIDLNGQQGEVRRLNEMLTNHLNEREAHYKKPQDEVVSLRHDLEKANHQQSQYQKITKGSKILYEILNKKIPSFIKVGLDFIEVSGLKKENFEGATN